MASDTGLPILLLSDSEDDETPSTPGNLDDFPTPTPEPKRREEAMRKRTQDAAANAPQHPIPSMQLAFAESLVEATTGTAAQKPKLKFGDAKERRNFLLDGARDAPLHGELWRYRPGQSHHELWKLMAQIAFGVYLLLNGIANSNTQVVNILQGHIDEVDEFLEITMEDVNLAIEDVKERLDLLKLPMENVATFERMLEDRAFRLQLVNGNERIEHVVSRSAAALEASFKDVDEGLKSTKEFAVYLGDQQHRVWRQQRPDVADIFDAMKGNAEGWYNAFVDLQENASVLDTLLIKLGQMVADMDRRAGEVSRRTRFTVAPYSGPTEDDLLSPSTSPGSSPGSSPTASRRPSDAYSITPSLQESENSTESPYFSSLPGSPFVADLLPELHFESPGSRDAAFADSTTFEADTEVGSPTREDRSSSSPEKEEGEDEEDKEEGLYILQPRTYTPQPPDPLPSPMIRDEEPPSPRLEETPTPKRASLRQRLSLRGNNPPESIQLPPRNSKRPDYQQPPARQGPDSAYGSDGEGRLKVHLDVVDSHGLTPPVLPHAVPSPLSDKQYFRPVQASPHSPLQQRPWTAAPGTQAPRPHTSATTHNHYMNPRNLPSAMGMSMMSNSTTADPQKKTLKKKRSAFGWLKKAFSLDEEERAAFEARKQQQAPNPYHRDPRSPKYLDGRRLPDDYRQYRGSS